MVDGAKLFAVAVGYSEGCRPAQTAVHDQDEEASEDARGLGQEVVEEYVEDFDLVLSAVRKVVVCNVPTTKM